mgnify:FL=1|jgi:hypothetical protein|tara:strand:+ start:131 stop:310 length:180 start_codon:yes stop_codon:yes gene_type:complete
MIKWFRTNKRLKELLKQKTEEADNIRNEWFRQRKLITELQRELELARKMWDVSDKTKRY